jgi:hypothetical protein
MPNSKYVGPAILVGGGLGAAALLYFAFRESSKVEEEVKEKLSSGGRFNARLTAYWPFKPGMTEAERRMEGGTKDRKGKPLITLEMHRADPAKYPYVSVAGDDAIWPYGQRIAIDAFPGVVFRVVDTGGHFRGTNKLYRVAGHEPLDICVDSPKSMKSQTSSATIFPGDNFAKGAAVAAGKMQGQKVALSGYSQDEDYDVLYRDVLEKLGVEL